jgi:major curlin subunit
MQEIQLCLSARPAAVMAQMLDRALTTVLSLTQNGFGNSATLDQWNSKDSTMTVSQYGGLNGASVDQTASNSSVSVTQVGIGNHVSAHQY